MFGISGMQFAAIVSGIVAGGLFVFGLLEFFKKESAWHRGSLLWILITFLGFVTIAFVLATQLTGASS